MNPNNKIFIDLELEQPNTKPECHDSLLTEEKIIQVGWCVFDVKTGIIQAENCVSINIGVPLSGFIKKLTGITDKEIQEGTSIEEVYKMLISDRNKYNCSRIVGQWGGGDMDCLKKELSQEVLASHKWEFGRSALNVKHLFQAWAEANEIPLSGGLKKSMNKMGIKFEGNAHNALTDAKNTAIIYKELSEYMKRG